MKLNFFLKSKGVSDNDQLAIKSLFFCDLINLIFFLRRFIELVNNILW